MKYLAYIDKRKGICTGVTVLEEIEEKEDDFTIYKEVNDFSFKNRKFDVIKREWLDEFISDEVTEDKGEVVTVETLQKNIEDLKEQSKKDNLLLLKTVLQAVEELTTPPEIVPGKEI